MSFFHSLFWAFVGFSVWKCIVWAVKCLLELFDSFFPALPLFFFVCLEISNWVLGLKVDMLIFFVQLLLICLFGDFFSFLPALLNLLLAFRFYLVSLRPSPLQFNLRSKLSLWSLFRAPVGWWADFLECVRLVGSSELFKTHSCFVFSVFQFRIRCCLFLSWWEFHSRNRLASCWLSPL